MSSCSLYFLISKYTEGNCHIGCTAVLLEFIRIGHGAFDGILLRISFAWARRIASIGFIALGRGQPVVFIKQHMTGKTEGTGGAVIFHQYIRMNRSGIEIPLLLLG